MTYLLTDIDDEKKGVEESCSSTCYLKDCLGFTVCVRDDVYYDMSTHALCDGACDMAYLLEAD